MFVFQAEDGIRDLVRSRGLGDVYKRQGWADKSPVAVVFLRNKDDLKKNIQRMDICKNIISAKTNTFIEIYSKGQHKIEKLIYMIHLVDWISFYLAKIRNVDVSEVKVIDFLKTELEKDRI